MSQAFITRGQTSAHLLRLPLPDFAAVLEDMHFIVHGPSVFRSEELSAALQLYQQAADVKLERPQQPDAAASESAQAVAEASLKLAFLCNDLLQVHSLQHPVLITVYYVLYLQYTYDTL